MIAAGANPTGGPHQYRDAVRQIKFQLLQTIHAEVHSSKDRPARGGRTVTTATSVLARAATGLRVGSMSLLAAPTHRGVDTSHREIAARFRESVPARVQTASSRPNHGGDHESALRRPAA